MIDQLGNRMKEYERVYSHRLLKNTPAVVRVDGRAFSGLVPSWMKPYSEEFALSMEQAARHVCEDISCAQFAYIQSDEVSFLFLDYQRKETSPPFDYKINKLISIIPSLMSVHFSRWFQRTMTAAGQQTLNRTTVFDGRAFNLPNTSEVIRYFIWRQKDCERNSVLSLAQKYIPHREMHKLSVKDLKEKLEEEWNVSWDGLPTKQKYGRTVIYRESEKWTIDHSPPLFTEEPQYLLQNTDLREEPQMW